MHDPGDRFRLRTVFRIGSRAALHFRLGFRLGLGARRGFRHRTCLCHRLLGPASDCFRLQKLLAVDVCIGLARLLVGFLPGLARNLRLAQRFVAGALLGSRLGSHFGLRLPFGFLAGPALGFDLGLGCLARLAFLLDHCLDFGTCARLGFFLR